jgi:hypothetical protein
MDFFRKILVVTLFMMLSASLVKAASFEVESVPIVDRISIEEFAKYQINIKNNLRQYDEYRIYSASFPTWDVRTEPLLNPITLELDGNSEGSVELVIDPLKIREIGTYGVNLNIKSKLTNELMTVPVQVTILSTEGLVGGYVPTVTTFVDIPQKIDPRKEVRIKITLNNQNIIDYETLVVKLDSALIKDTMETKLGSREEKTLEMTYNLDPLTSPKKDSLVIALLMDDRSIINPIVKNFEIVEYGDQNLLSEKKGLFLTKSRYEFVSNNPNPSGRIKVETTLLSSIFSAENPKAKVVKENGKRYFVWDVESSRMEVSVTKNFIPLVFAIALLIVVVIAYFTIRSPLLIRKETSNIVKKEGGVSEMSVIVHVRNRGKGKLKDIEITETIPSIVSIEREISIGALQPSRILKHEKKGTTIVKWDLDSLDASEERVLSYRIKTKLSILGGFSLPSASSVFKSNGKTLTAVSNRLSVGE